MYKAESHLIVLIVGRISCHIVQVWRFFRGKFAILLPNLPLAMVVGGMQANNDTFLQ